MYMCHSRTPTKEKEDEKKRNKRVELCMESTQKKLNRDLYKLTGTRDALTHTQIPQRGEKKLESMRARRKGKRKNDHKITTYNRRNHTFRVST